ncbi:ABC transporter permease [Nocardioides mesophilus]|uniref:FtsX-like permease family protein n=1 Tax=Nocardioides mesophilus TaxID=433659 RepID=A0A7G9REW2_9ACTN|nr:FtsX-like permease family protein [Nocardioides mesophilus]QNN54137.1 FtsX-like permease family protein [Nocardioides mesophilus]
MRELFGIQVTSLAVVLGVLVVLALAAVGILALRSPVLFKLGVRNMSRRRGRTAIIVGGLMLGTMIIGSALAFGDIMSSTVRSSVITSLGQTDEVVSHRSANAPDIPTVGQSTGAKYLTAAEAGAVLAAARDIASVDGAGPEISESVAVQDRTSRATEPQVTLFATDPGSMTGFGQITSTSGGRVGLEQLGRHEVYLNSKAADDLSAGPGDQLVVFAAGRQRPVTVAQVVEYDGTGTDGDALLMDLRSAQRLLGVGTTVQQVRISNVGTAVSGAQRTDEVTTALETTTGPLGLQIDPVKRDGLQQADDQGATYLSLFSTFGTFTISAGILLIFLVFVMLAAERRGEMGTARAIGTQRRHLVEMFVFEGAAYDVLAAVVGAFLGLGLAVGMVRVLAGALADTGITIRYTLTWTSLIVAFSLGVLLTLAVVLVAAWRVSRLNIVAAVRNLPQPPKRRRRRSNGLLVAACLVLGALMIAMASRSDSAATFLVGGTVGLLAVVPLTRLLGGSDRLAYSLGGVCVVVWNLLPFRVYDQLMPGLKMGFSVWILVGLMLVAGSTWVVVYNLPALLGALMWVFGRFRRAAPVVRTAIAQPMRNRFRTGATIGLFTLVVFTMVTGASISMSILSAIDDEKTFSGGYDVTAQTSPLSPVTNMDRALARAPGVDQADFVSTAGQSYVPVDARQVGHQAYAGYVLRGLSDSFARTTTYGFATRARGYGSDRAVWKALQSQPGLAVVDSLSVPRRANWGSAAPSDFRLSGFYLEDKSFDPVQVQVRDTQSGKVIRLTVIGVLADNVPYTMVGLSTSQRTLAPLGAAAAPTVWYFKTASGVDPVAAAKQLEAGFLGNGMQATAMSELLDDAVSASLTFQYLILGFLGLGLVIGVAALGVIAARSVVERRQQIGVLRAIGFQARMVQVSFLVESLFVTLVGVVLGTVLGLVVAFNVVTDTARQPGWDNLVLQPPWGSLGLILGVVVLSSLVTTWLPSLRASRTYPASALRYE